MPPPDSVPPQPKPKLQFKLPKMPSVKLNKTTKVFMCVLAMGMCSIGIGFLYDLPLLGQGLKVGMGVALGVIALFFAVKIFVILDDKD